MNLKKRFGARLQQLRKRAGLTQAGLAERLNTGPEVVSRMERGQSWVSAERLQALARALGVPPMELLNVEEKPSLTAATPYDPEIVHIVNLLDGRPPGEIKKIRQALKALLS